MSFLNVYNEKEKCVECNTKVVQFIVVEEPTKHLCRDCLIIKINEGGK
jgi:formamidopyrimidine-DNA glycosylase